VENGVEFVGTDGLEQGCPKGDIRIPRRAIRLAPMTKHPPGDPSQSVPSRESDLVRNASPQPRSEHHAILQSFAQMQTELDGLRRASNRLSPPVDLRKER
jgi:hypothetical protein